MKPLASLAAAFAATVAPVSALACNPVQPRPYLRDAPPGRIDDNQIVAEVELDMDTPVSVRDQGTRFRVRRMIEGEPAVALVVPFEICSPETPGRLSGFMVATRISREGDVLVVNPVQLESGLFHAPLMTPRSTE